MDLIGFAIAVLLIELTPGPNMGWLVTLTLSEGRRSGLGAIWGIALGLASNAVLSVLAASYILEQSDIMVRSTAFLGAAMMAYLAWQAWREAGESSHANAPLHGSRRNFLAGFTINLLNAKATLFFVTVMPQFVTDGRPGLAEGLVLAAISVTIATMVHLAFVLGAERIRPVLLLESRSRFIRRVLALGMLGVGIWFLIKAFG